MKDIEPRKQSSPSESQDFRGELLKAVGRIGKSSEEIMQWLFGFVRRDWVSLSKGDRINRQYEITAFTHLRRFANSPSRLASDVILTDEAGTDTNVTGLISDGDAEAIQQNARKMLDAIIEKSPLSFSLPINRALLFRHTPGDWIEIITIKSPLVIFKHFVFEALKIHINQIRRCPEFQHDECLGFFLVKRRKRFCSSKCQSRCATNRWRKAHGLITGRRPGRPRKDERQAVPQSKQRGHRKSAKGGSRHGTKRR